MTEYRIVTRIDPSGVTQGSQKVKQELRGIDTAAKQTQRALDTAGESGKKVAGNLGQVSSVSTSAAKGQRDLAAAAGQVGKAADAEAKEIAQLNALLAQNKALLDSGAISAQQFAKVQGLVDNAVGRNTRSLGQQRAGYTQLGFQVQDITQTLALGINPLVVLAQQGGQTASALQMALGEQGTAGKVAAFMAGPFGSLILAGVTVVGLLGLEFLKTGSAIDEATKKLQEDAAATEAARQAKAIFATTLDGVTDAVRKNQEALDKLNDSGKTAARVTLENALVAQANLAVIRETTRANIEKARSILAIENASEPTGSSASDLVLRQQRISERETALNKLEDSLKATDGVLSKIDGQISEALGRRAVELAVDQSTAVGRITAKYTDLIESTRLQATADEIANGVLARKILRLKELEKAETDAANAAERRTKVSDGVARFRTREQAIGIAGRELQGIGLRVSENNQFGGVRGQHSNNADHGKNAIDVNVGKGITEANVPALKARFDALARQYQARGYKVLWAGKVWAAGGNGPTGPITGADKHYDHMHLYAPGTIVGKETQASTQAQANREAEGEIRTAEQASDFVQNVVDQSAARGQGGSRTDTLKAQIDRTLADFQRRFDRAAGPDETAKITTALTDADAREAGQRFDEAYVKPLQRLQALQGTIGLEREVMNAQLEETERLGRELLPTEKQAIENGIRQGDALNRQRAILEAIRDPLLDHNAQIAALNKLLADGKIKQDEYNRALEDLPLNRQNRAQQNRLGGGGEIGEKLERMRQDAEEERILADQLREAKIISEQEHKDRLLEIERQYNNAKRDMALGAAGELFGSLADIAEAGFGRQSAVYKAAFVAQKAVAIAQSIIAIQTGIAQALSLPFPGNLIAVATVAAQAASIVANIKAVTLNLKDGGYVSGPGGPRDDQVAANLSNGEFVVNAAATARNRAALEAINNGTMNARQSRATASQAAGVQAATGDSYQLSFGDVVVNAGGGTTAADGRQIGRDVKDALKTLVRDEIKNAKRDGGALTKTRQSVMS